METIYVNVKLEDGLDKTVEVEIDIEDFKECDNNSKKISYIKKMTKEQFDNIAEVNFMKEDLKEVQHFVNDIYDTSDWHPNETFEEFMEHENFD